MPHAPPPHVCDDGPRDANGGSVRAAVEVVHEDVGVGEVLGRERDEPPEARLCAGRGERAGEVDERVEESVCVGVRAEGQVEDLRWGLRVSGSCGGATWMD